ncbi:peroxisomal carnitine O-octanoyltransferase-like [Branchiostoma floridae]|uniref:Peroxisomal carnitine O-octanoyltransferase n=1 Tax=Branchiostoma floridae TaxID=7739 RepID=A0A9J7MAT5_BRAFL|nr:peroxisomal carnitine O-octanoyltransferase-like [Branchiostoma floridae]
MSLTRVHRNALQLLEYVASHTGLTEAVRKLQLAQQFTASDEELKQLQLKWIPRRLQGWLLKKAIQMFGERTWKYQDSLPPLPVPPLKNTLDKYLESVKPFVTAEEYKQTEAVVREFEEGVGQSLQQQLLERAKVKRNWLEDWWVDLMYLQSRHSLPLASNVVGFVPIMDHMWSAVGAEPADRVPLFLWAALYLWKLLRKEQIPVDKDVLTGQPFCMNQFRSMFSAHRIPGVTMDKIVSHFKTESEGPSPTHIMVLCKGRVFKMEVIDQEGEPLTPAELKTQLEVVKQQCENVCEGPHISVLTAGNRTEWAKTREKMVEMDPVNARNLSVIEKSIVVLAFDDATPKDSGEVLRQVLVGSSRNRWFDHVNTGVAFKSGIFASQVDVRFCLHICITLEKILHIIRIVKECIVVNQKDFNTRQVAITQATGYDFGNGQTFQITPVSDNVISIFLAQIGASHNSFPMPVYSCGQYLHCLSLQRDYIVYIFSILQQMAWWVFIIKTSFLLRLRGLHQLKSPPASDLELVCPSFTDYGKKFIRSFKLHPDAYMQAALQLAYFRLHGKPAQTYESATLRRYYHGRLETVRSCTMEMVSWCKATMDNTVPIKEKKELMMAALKKHVQLMEEAKNMLGCDRHLFGLQVIAQGAGIPLPSIFRDAAFTKKVGGGFALVTALIGYTPVPGAVAPKMHNGYCILYNIQAERLTYSVSAWRSSKETSAEEMSASIQQLLRDMRQLLMTS